MWLPQVAAGLIFGATMTAVIFSIYTWLFLRSGYRRAQIFSWVLILVFIFFMSGVWQQLVRALTGTGIGVTGAVKVSPAWLLLGAACFLVCLRLARRDFSRREL